MSTSQTSQRSLDQVALKNATLALFKELRTLTRGSPYQLSDEIQKMRSWLTRDREMRPSGYMNQPRAFSAYTAYHLPLHLTELFWILEQNFSRLKLSAPTKILDLGSGPGTTTLSALLWLYYKKQNLPQHITLFDQSSRANSTAEQMVKFLAKELDPQNKPSIKALRGNLLHRKDLKTIGTGYDWITLSHVLNEFGNGPRHRHKKLEFLQGIVQDQMPQSGGLLFIVEPPLRECTLDLMWLRDQLTQKTRADEAERKLSRTKGNDDPFAQSDEVDGDEDFSDEESFEESAYDEDQDDDRELSPAQSMNSTVIAPCPSQTTYCPMALARAGWCYAQPPREQFRALGLCPWDNEIEAALRIQWSQPGFSYLIVHAQGKRPPIKEVSFSPSSHGIALTDATRAPSMVCRAKRLRKEDRAPFRGAYIDKKIKDLD